MWAAKGLWYMLTTMVKVDKSGRLVLPARARRALGIERGGDLVLTVEDNGELRLVSQAVALTQVQDLVRTRTRGRLLSEELSAERRADTVHD